MPSLRIYTTQLYYEYCFYYTRYFRLCYPTKKLQEKYGQPVTQENRHATIIEIAIPLYLERTFHYLVPEKLREQALTGRRALVPFGNRKLTGYILGNAAGSGIANLKEIIDVLDSESLWTPGELEFYRWVASYYQHPLGEVVRTALPAGINIQTRKGTSGEKAALTGGKPPAVRSFISPARWWSPPVTPAPRRWKYLRSFAKPGIFQLRICANASVRAPATQATYRTRFEYNRRARSIP